MHIGVRHEHGCSFQVEGCKKMKAVAPANNIALLNEHDPQECRALGQILDRIGDKWTVMVVGVLSKGPLCFTAMNRELGGISHRRFDVSVWSLVRDGRGAC